MLLFCNPPGICQSAVLQSVNTVISVSPRLLSLLSVLFSLCVCVHMHVHCRRWMRVISIGPGTTLSL